MIQKPFIDKSYRDMLYELLRQLDLEEMAMREYEKAIAPFEAKLQANERLLEEKEKYIQELLKKLETQGK